MQATSELAERISRISVSSTMKVAADADKLRREGVDIVDFSAGEPDFPTPENIKKAAIAAIDANFTKYTPMGGTVELKQAICARHHDDYGTSYTPAECLVTVGGKHAHLQSDAGAHRGRRRSDHPCSLLGDLQRRRELCGRQVRLCRQATSQRLHVHCRRHRAHTSLPRPKLLIINSPCNPSGARVRAANISRRSIIWRRSAASN